jgi:hypothetical protein
MSVTVALTNFALRPKLRCRKEDSMRQLTPDGDADATPTSQAWRLRQEIRRYRRRLLEVRDSPKTIHVLQLLLTNAQSLLDQIKERANSL